MVAWLPLPAPATTVLFLNEFHIVSDTFEPYRQIYMVPPCDLMLDIYQPAAGFLLCVCFSINVFILVFREDVRLSF